MDEQRPAPPPVLEAVLKEELPTLELELKQLAARVAEVERKVIWLERGVEAWARGRNWQGDRDATEHR